jgi:hypothetical protein
LRHPDVKRDSPASMGRIVTIDAGLPQSLFWAGELLPPRLRQGIRHCVELGVGVGADGLNRRQADHDDQRQHDRVLDGGRTIFGTQKTFDAVGEILHVHGKSLYRSP